MNYPLTQEAALKLRYSEARQRLGMGSVHPKMAPVPKPSVIRMKPAQRDWLRIEPSALTVSGANDATSWRKILFEVAEYHRVTPADILSARRQREIVAARHEYIWRLRYETTMSLEAIGRRCGGRDHSTVKSAIKSHERRTKPAAIFSIEKRRQEFMKEKKMNEREMIEAMILEGATNYRIQVECGVGRIKVKRIRKEMMNAE